MKRSCQRQTQVFDVPVCRMISLVPTPVGGQKDDLGSPDMLLGTVAICGHGLQTATNGRSNGEGYSCAHPINSHAPPKQESPYGIQMLKFIH